MPTLFHPALLRMLEFEHHLAAEQCPPKHDALRRLTARMADGCLAGLVETRIEQSFNERLFAEVFDYLTLLRHGVRDTYHLLPKGGVVVGGARHYDDFSLGFFGPKERRRLVHAELKGYGTKLDKKQTGGSYGGKTPVEQAFAASIHVPSIEWIVVSNFDEMRLYHRSSSVNHERILLSDITSNRDLRRAYTLFGREALLGDPGQPSPLLRLLRGGPPMLLPSQVDGVRLIHEARPLVGDDEASLPAMDEAFRNALAASAGWPWAVPSSDPQYVDDRLVVADDTYAVSRARLEYTRNGVVRLQERLQTEEPSGAAPPVLVSAETIAHHMCMFLATAGRMLEPFPGRKVFRWSLLDGKSLVVLRRAGPGLRGGPEEISTKEFDPDVSQLSASSRAHLAGYVTKAIKDLLFPWHYARSRGAIDRLAWSDAESERLLQHVGI